MMRSSESTLVVGTMTQMASRMSSESCRCGQEGYCRVNADVAVTGEMSLVTSESALVVSDAETSLLASVSSRVSGCCYLWWPQ